MNVVASGRARATSSATAWWSGPITTASEAPAPFGAASSTCASSDWPATGCSTFGSEERIRVPSPAASTTVRLDRAVIGSPLEILNRSGRIAPAPSLGVFAVSGNPIRPPAKFRIQVHRGFPVNVCSVIRLGLKGGQRRLAKNTDHRSGGLDTDDTGGVLSGLLAEEDDLDRRALWRIGSWGVGAVAAVTLAVMANQTQLGWKRDQVAASDITRQAQQIQQVAKETHSE